MEGKEIRSRGWNWREARWKVHEGVAETSVGRGGRGMEKREETSRRGAAAGEFWAGGAFREPEFEVDLWILRSGSTVPLEKDETFICEAFLE